jgi:hypothetical protein
MKKIEEGMITAIKNGKDYKKDNTEIYNYKDEIHSVIQVYLYGRRVATIYPDKIHLLDIGWRTTTTKSRLNAILSHYDLGKLYSKNYTWYLKTNDEDEEWTGSKTFEISK